METNFSFTSPELNPWLLALDIALMLHVAWSYWRNCLRRGYKLDLWHMNLLLSFVLPMMVNFIFAGALENRMSVWGDGVSAIQTTMDKAFLIHVLGYIMFHLGSMQYQRTRGARGILGQLAYSPVNWMADQFEKFANSPAVMIGWLLPTLAGGAYLLQQAGGGIRFDLRNLIMSDGVARPLYGFCFQAAGPLLLTASFARFIRRKTVISAAFVALMVFFEILSGTRSAIILPMGTLAAVYAVKQRKKLTFSFLLAAGACMLFLGLALSVARNEASAKSVATAPRHDALEEFAYGNEYSDLRDFSWFLSKWDGEPALGRTYLAGALGFLPRVFFFTSFRDVWGFGPYSGAFLGLNADHPGVRIGFFGEAYTNFGYFGVILIGLVGGYLVRMMDELIKLRVIYANADMVSAVAMTQGMLLVHNIAFSTAMWVLYSVLLILLVTYMLVKDPKSGAERAARRTALRATSRFSAA